VLVSSCMTSASTQVYIIDHLYMSVSGRLLSIVYISKPVDIAHSKMFFIAIEYIGALHHEPMAMK
jgi:hypothetical protein